MQNVMVYLAGLTVLVAGDLLWLGFLMRKFYADNLGHLMASTVNWVPAILFYLIYTAGVWVFVVQAEGPKGMAAVALKGALLGALCYAVYDLTNHATLRNWPLAVTLVDIAWGAFLTMLVALAMAKVKQLS